MIAIGASLKRLLGTDFYLLKGYEHLATAASNHKAAAAFFPMNRIPIWLWIVVAGAIVFLAGYFYAFRLKGRGCTDTQKRRVDLAYHALGFIAVALIFSLLYTAASVADWRPLFGG
jgi:bacteriorhodopsin